MIMFAFYVKEHVLGKKNNKENNLLKAFNEHKDNVQTLDEWFCQYLE